jgi:putative holliday junction resolvase
MRSIALDYWTQKTGLAYSVEGFCFAWKTVLTRLLLADIQRYISERKAETLVIGMPYNIDGSISKHGKRVEEFARKLEALIQIPIVLHDERLTTSEAEMAFDDMGVDGDLDAEAARLILVDYLKTLS